MEPDKYGDPGGKCLILEIECEDGKVRKDFNRRQKLTTISNAVTHIGADVIEQGGQIKIWLEDERPSSRGAIPTKVYGAAYL